MKRRRRSLQLRSKQIVHRDNSRAIARRQVSKAIVLLRSRAIVRQVSKAAVRQDRRENDQEAARQAAAIVRIAVMPAIAATDRALLLARTVLDKAEQAHRALREDGLQQSVMTAAVRRRKAATAQLRKELGAALKEGPVSKAIAVKTEAARAIRARAMPRSVSMTVKAATSEAITGTPKDAAAKINISSHRARKLTTLPKRLLCAAQ